MQKMQKMQKMLRLIDEEKFARLLHDTTFLDYEQTRSIFDALEFATTAWDNVVPISEYWGVKAERDFLDEQLKFRFALELTERGKKNEID